jgi:hypothetical protein
LEIIPLCPVDSTDNEFRQLNETILDSPYVQAGINGFQPPQPFHVSEHYIPTNEDTSFNWPMLTEMNTEFFSSNDVDC